LTTFEKLSNLIQQVVKSEVIKI